MSGAEDVERFEVPETGVRLDRFLLKVVAGAGSEQVASWIDSGAVRIRGKVPKPLRRLHRGEVVELCRPAPMPVSLPGAPTLPVLFESDAIVIINKPAHLAVEPAGTMASVVGALAAQLRGFDVGGQARPGVVHRLDKDTSGCLVLAKNDAAMAALHQAFDAHQIEKTYLALVRGHAPPAGHLNTAYGRSRGDSRRYTTHVRSPRRAKLSWTCLAHAGDCSVLQVRLQTGRTHQIRVQLSEAHLPVLGDPFYGPREARDHPAAPGRQALHAQRLVLPHPITGERVDVRAPVPVDLCQALEQLQPGLSHVVAATE